MAGEDTSRFWSCWGVEPGIFSEDGVRDGWGLISVNG